MQILSDVKIKTDFNKVNFMQKLILCAKWTEYDGKFAIILYGRTIFKG